MTRIDTFTNTEADAADFERRYGPEYDDDRPSLSELYDGDDEPDDWMQAVIDNGPPDEDLP